MSDCGNTILVNYSNDEPCELKSTDCVVYEEAISYLSLNTGSTTTEVIQALLTSLINARNRIQTLETITLYTVATLPNAQVGQVEIVEDATSPVYRQQVTGGGTELSKVMYDGNVWINI